MSEKLTYPPEAYGQLFLTLYEQLNGPESLEPMLEQKGRSYQARIWCSRGEVLEKAGLTLLHLTHQDADGPRFVRHFDTVIHPNNPRVPGVVVVIGQEYIERVDRRRIYCLVDLWRTTRRPNGKAVDQFRQAIEGVCQNYERSYSRLRQALPALQLFGGNGCHAGLFYSDFDPADIPFINQIVRCVVSEIPLMIESCQRSAPSVQDFMERNEIRREFLAWALHQSSEHQRVVAAGVPWTVFEAFAFPPEVHY